MSMSLGFGTWRLFLALLVGASHLWVDMVAGPAAYAVWGFFVLSGYLMTHVLSTKYGFSARGIAGYAHNRFLRIFPGFWIACLVSALVLWWLAQRGIDPHRLNPAFGLPRDRSEWGFLITLLPSFPRWNAPVPVANALSIEVGFYLLMPLLARHRTTAVLALLFGIFIVVDHGFGVDSFANRYAWFLPSTPAFALGSVIFHWRDSLARIAAPRLALPVWLAHSVLIWWLPVWPWTYGLYVSLLLSAWVVISLAERPTSRFDNVMGELSYPFYLLHSTAGVLLFAWFGYDRDLTYGVAAVALTLAASWAMVLLVDRPLTRRKRPALLNPPRDQAHHPDPVVTAVEAPQRA
jgi:peptidoglycan/LPS O-acetylase OafA/YrhL